MPIDKTLNYDYLDLVDGPMYEYIYGYFDDDGLFKFDQYQVINIINKC